MVGLPLRSLDVLISAAHQANSQYLCLPELHRTGISEADQNFLCTGFPLLAVFCFGVFLGGVLVFVCLCSHCSYWKWEHLHGLAKVSNGRGLWYPLLIIKPLEES